MKKSIQWLGLAFCFAAAALLGACGKQGGQADDASAPPTSGGQTQQETLPPAQSAPLPADRETPGLTPDSAALSEAELADWAAYLSGQGVCELFLTPFASPDEIDLSILFYDGLPLSAALTEGERAELEAAVGEIHLDVVKVTAEEIAAQFQLLTGAELTGREIRSRMTGWYYLEDYDAYYHIHGDTAMVKVSCTAGVLDDRDGSVTLTCSLNGDRESVYTVTLAETKDAYRFTALRAGKN